MAPAHTGGYTQGEVTQRETSQSERKQLGAITSHRRAAGQFWTRFLSQSPRLAAPACPPPPPCPPPPRRPPRTGWAPPPTSPCSGCSDRMSAPRCTRRWSGGCCGGRSAAAGPRAAAGARWRCPRCCPGRSRPGRGTSSDLWPCPSAPSGWPPSDGCHWRLGWWVWAGSRGEAAAAVSSRPGARWSSGPRPSPRRCCSGGRRPRGGRPGRTAGCRTGWPRPPTLSSSASSSDWDRGDRTKLIVLQVLSLRPKCQSDPSGANSSLLTVSNSDVCKDKQCLHNDGGYWSVRVCNEVPHVPTVTGKLQRVHKKK